MSILSTLLISTLLVLSRVVNADDSATTETTEKATPEESKTSDESVITLSSANFDEFVSGHPRVLVEFYAPWCGHCKSLAPEYEAAAQVIHGDSELDAHLAKVDATDELNKDLATKYGVRGFPTLKYFTQNLDTPDDYSGGRTKDTIIQWIRTRSMPPVTILNTEEEFNNLKTKSKIVLIGCFDEESDESTSLTRVAEGNREIVLVGQITDKKLSESIEGLDHGSLYLYRDFGEPKKLKFEGDDLSVDSITQFLNSERFPLIDEIGPDNYKDYMDRGLPLVWISLNPEETEEKTNVIQILETYAQRYKGVLSFTWVDAVKYAQHVQNLGISETPGMMIVSDNNKYLYSGEISGTDSSKESLNLFWQNFDDGKLEPHLKSQEIPEKNDEPVYVLVGKEFNNVIGSEKDVFLEFYAPWCGHCKRLAPEYEKVGEAFKDVSNVIVAKIDATENDTPEEIQGFPTLIFYPKGQKVGIKYEGERKAESIIGFIKETATVDVSGVKTEL